MRSESGLPDRGRPAQVAEAMPLGVIRTLTHEVRIPEAEVQAMTKAEAIARLSEFYLTGR